MRPTKRFHAAPAREGLSRVPVVEPEIVEDTNQVSIDVGGDKFAQLPRFVFGFGNDFRARGFPLDEKLVHFRFVIEVQPEKHGAGIAVRFAEGFVGDEQAAIASGDAGEAAVVIAEIESEAERVHVVGNCFVHVDCGDFRNGRGKFHAANRNTIAVGREGASAVGHSGEKHFEGLAVAKEDEIDGLSAVELFQEIYIVEDPFPSGLDGAAQIFPCIGRKRKSDAEIGFGANALNVEDGACAVGVGSFERFEDRGVLPAGSGGECVVELEAEKWNDGIVAASFAFPASEFLQGGVDGWLVRYRVVIRLSADFPPPLNQMPGVLLPQLRRVIDDQDGC